MLFLTPWTHIHFLEFAKLRWLWDYISFDFLSLFFFFAFGACLSLVWEVVIYFILLLRCWSLRVRPSKAVYLEQGAFPHA